MKNFKNNKISHEIASYFDEKDSLVWKKFRFDLEGKSNIFESNSFGFAAPFSGKERGFRCEFELLGEKIWIEDSDMRVVGGERIQV